MLLQRKESSKALADAITSQVSKKQETTVQAVAVGTVLKNSTGKAGFQALNSPVYVTDYVVAHVKKEKVLGTCVFVDKVIVASEHAEARIYVGIDALDPNYGKGHDGTVDNQQLFKCKSKCGILAVPKNVEKYIVPGSIGEAFDAIGFLEKQGSMVKNWKQRFFVLAANTLFYYETPFSKKENGHLQLDLTPTTVRIGVTSYYIYRLKNAMKKLASHLPSKSRHQKRP